MAMSDHNDDDDPPPPTTTMMMPVNGLEKWPTKRNDDDHEDDE